MTLEQLKERYGPEYPTAIVVDGVRLALSQERRFSRSYDADDHRISSVVSRFVDGSASMTYAQLEAEWPAWTEHERLDFCNACAWLHTQADFPDMLRFVMTHGAPREQSAVALCVASELPQAEAFDILVRALHRVGPGDASNITQAIALTRHADAESTLRAHLQHVWTHPELWDDANFVNWLAFDAATCISYLIALDVPAADFEDQVRQLARHRCAGNRRSCRAVFSKHYRWLAEGEANSDGE